MLNEFAPPGTTIDMRRTHPLLLSPLLSACLLLIPCACAPRRAAEPTSPRQQQPYTGPTDPMAVVVEAINRNNNLVPTLWARHYYEATIVDEQGKGHFVNGDGALLYRRPQGMRLVGTKPGVGTVFEVGSTDDRYWLSIAPEMDTMWWGNYEHLGKPCVAQVPIRPDMVLEVLGVTTFNTNFLEPPVPVMRFNPDADAYTFVWNVPLPNRWVAVKEVWYDRQTKLPRLVLLFDENGRVVLRARLSNHTAVEVPDVPREQWPKVATNYQLYFPDTGTKMSFELSDLVLDKNGVPGRRGIAFPKADLEKFAKVIQLDEACAD